MLQLNPMETFLNEKFIDKNSSKVKLKLKQLKWSRIYDMERAKERR